MKVAFIIPAMALSVYLQAEILDFNPLLQIMADAPVYAVFVWLFYLQQKQQERLTRAIVQLSTQKSAAREVVE